MSIVIDKLDLSIGQKIICRGLSLEIHDGDSWAVLGTNGVGKSTLLYRLLDVEHADADRIRIQGKPLSDYRGQRRKLAQQLGILLQDYEYTFPTTVLETVMIGRHPYLSAWQWETERDRAIARQALQQLDLLALQNRQIQTLSGGEKRRVNLATLLTQSPKHLLLDEPTNHLDMAAQIQVLDLLQSLVSKHNKTTVTVLHDANLARRYCNKVLMLFGEGQWLAGDASELINVSNLEQLYRCRIQAFQGDSQTVYLPG